MVRVRALRNPAISAAILLACLLPAYAAGQSLPRGYEILDLTSDPLRQDKPRMNNSGQIVFNAGPRDGTLDIVLYQPDGTFGARHAS